MNYHIVQKGESLWQIAKMHNISLQALIDANPQLENPNAVGVGTKIFVPSCSEDWKIPEPPTNNSNNNKNENSNGDKENNKNNESVVDDKDIENADLCKKLAALPRPLIYVVKKGDTLYKISKCFEIGLKELMQVNSQIKNPDLVSPGDKIFIPRSKNICGIDSINNHPHSNINLNGMNTCPYCGRPMPR